MDTPEDDDMIKVELTEPEFQSLINLMDAGVKAAGLQAVTMAAVLVAKFDEAIKVSRETKDTKDNVVSLPAKEA